jgi:predicted nucleic acid-binding protein
MTPPFLLDTSALFAHCLEEPGGDLVETILDRFPGEARISVVTWLEFKLRLDEIHSDAEVCREILACYAELLDDPEPVSKEVAGAAYDLRRRATRRIPNVDALIAATAILQGATLVHRDPHLSALPPKLVKQIVLPAKSRASSPEPDARPISSKRKSRPRSSISRTTGVAGMAVLPRSCPAADGIRAHTATIDLGAPRASRHGTEHTSGER